MLFISLPLLSSPATRARINGSTKVQVNLNSTAASAKRSSCGVWNSSAMPASNKP
ncbi:hypothetical protein D3C87_2205710 [compost metagenome]